MAIVLPRREGFSPAAVGAIGLAVRRLARGTDAVVVGMPVDQPFADVRFQPAAPIGWWRGRNAAYAAGVLRALRQLRPALTEVHNRPDIALAVARGLPAGKVVLFLHNDPIGMRETRTAARRKRLLRRLARVVTVSDWLRDRLLMGVPKPVPSPIVLPNALDLAELPPEQPRDPVILFAGRMVADKGADLFVQAVAQVLPDLPGWRAEMIGADRFTADAPDTLFLQALRPLAGAAGIHLAGYQPHAAVLAAMTRAAIVVVPSRWPEPFGLSALEAIACGAATICTARGGLPEVVGDAALIIEPDAAALAAALRALANDPDRRAALGRAGRQRARRFDRPGIVAALAQLRAEILQ